jgi:F-type H+-transporting ATPase subunit b
MTISARQFTAFTAVILMAGNASAEGAAFPQLDTASFPNQLAWLAITFVALYLIVSKSIVPTVSEVLSARKATIADAIAKAEAFKKHADETRGSAEAGGQKARAKAAETMAKANAEAAKKQAEAMAELNAELDKQSAKASAALAKTVKAASGELETASAELAQAIAEKLLGSQVDAASVKAARTKAA